MVRISKTGYVLNLVSVQQNLLRGRVWGVDFVFQNGTVSGKSRFEGNGKLGI